MSRRTIDPVMVQIFVRASDSITLSSAQQRTFYSPASSYLLNKISIDNTKQT